MEKNVFTKKNSCAQNRVGKLTYMFFTDFLHMFTFLKLSGSWRKKFFVKSDFFPKIANFCRKGLPLSKTYWMIVSPQKRVKKIPTICTCQTFIYNAQWDYSRLPILQFLVFVDIYSLSEVEELSCHFKWSKLLKSDTNTVWELRSFPSRLRA